jgi:asparagine synthase (glutamine-hydrolysing)
MSGIAGLIYFDGKHITTELDSMAKALKHRGPDGIRFWQDGHVGLVSLALNLKKQTNQQPISEANGRVMVEDGPPAPKEGANNTPSGDGGDFAFAIWDAPNQQFVCGRDHAGVRTFYYVFEANKYFAFASEIKALLTLPQISGDINEAKVNRYLSWGSANRPYRSETFYKNIYSLPPANVLTVSKDKITSRLDWVIDLDKFSYLKTDDDHVQAFKETLIEAVRCRVLTDFPVSAHLSGGLDSSSVSVIANQFLSHPLHTLHFDVGPSANEKPFAEAVLLTGDFKHEYVAARPNLLETIKESARIFDRPDHFTILPTFHLANAEAVQKNGSRTLLTGHDGDSVVGFGRAYPLSLFRAQDWTGFTEIMTKYAQVADFEDDIIGWRKMSVKKRTQQLIHLYSKSEILSKFKTREYEEGITLMADVLIKTNASGWLYVEDLFEKIRTPKPAPKLKFDFETDYGFTHELNESLADIIHEGMYEATEQFTHIGAHYGHEVAHPFYDKQLLELCLSTPDRLKFDNGYRRGQMRRAMTGLLPEEVRLRTSKVNFNTVISNELRANKDEIVAAIQSKLIGLSQESYLKNQLQNTIKWLTTNDPTSPTHFIRYMHWAFWAK